MSKEQGEGQSYAFEYREWRVYVKAASDGTAYLGAFVAVRGDERISDFFADSQESLRMAIAVATVGARNAIDAKLEAGPAKDKAVPDSPGILPDDGLEGAG